MYNNKCKKTGLCQIICILAILSVQTLFSVSHSQTISLTLHEKAKTVKEILNTIELQTKFVFFYNDKDIDLNRKVTINQTKQSISAILTKLFEDSSTSYKIDGNQIFLTKKVESDPKKKAEPTNNKIKIEGIVRDEAGEPVIGATVTVVGTTIGIATDINGYFSLDVPETGQLQISYIGYETRIISIDRNLIYNISISPLRKTLEDVVIVGYGTQKKVSLTGSISSIGTKDIARTSAATLSAALAGKLPGLSSVQTVGGQPGRDNAAMYLRGTATVNGQNPLILVDGVPRDDISVITPNEVANISVLKDASATALFGVRGANGVILITTRRGTSGEMNLSLSFQQSFISFTKEPKRLHSVEYMRLRNEASLNDGISADNLPFNESTINKYINPLEGLDINSPDYARQVRIRNYIYPDHDYYRELISRYVPQSRVNLSMSGGSDKIQYFTNVSYLHQGGNLRTESKNYLKYDPSSWMDRYSLRANVDYKISESLKASVSIGGYLKKVNMPATWYYSGDSDWMMRDIIHKTRATLPITPGPTTMNDFGVVPNMVVIPDYIESAFECINRKGYNNETHSNMNGSLAFEWDLSKTVTKGLSVKSMISLDTYGTSITQGNKTENLYVANIIPETNTLTYTLKSQNEGLLSVNKSEYSNYALNVQGLINYHRIFGEKHEVGGMLLAQRDYWESNIADLPYNILGISGRVTYSYKSCYLGEFNVGYNGSEQFAPNKRFGFFPAVSLGWVISNENFWRGNNIIPFLKLRGSYGKVGNDKMGSSRFLYLDNITVDSNGTLESLGRGTAINLGLLGNPNITWEIAKKRNYGIDLHLLQDIRMTFDYFIENRSQILIERGSMPSLLGVPSKNMSKGNIGRIKNQGFEIELSYNKAFTKDLFFQVKGNLGYNHNIVKFYDEAMRDESFYHQYRITGYPIGQQWGYKIDYSNGNGYFNSQEELDKYLSSTIYGFGMPRVGDFKYIDFNKDGIVDDKDMVPIKHSYIPEYTYGITLNLSYRSFDLMALFQGVEDFSTYFGATEEYHYQGTYHDYTRTAWTEERYLNSEKITYPALSTKSNTNHVPNDFFIVDRSFLRLKNLEIGYTLSDKITKKLKLANVRFYIRGENLITWDHLPMKYLDPENSNTIGYPITKQQSIGFDIKF